MTIAPNQSDGRLVNYREKEGKPGWAASKGNIMTDNTHKYEPLSEAELVRWEKRLAIPEPGHCFDRSTLNRLIATIRDRDRKIARLQETIDGVAKSLAGPR